MLHLVIKRMEMFNDTEMRFQCLKTWFKNFEMNLKTKDHKQQVTMTGKMRRLNLR